MIWVINANSNICRIFQYDKNPGQLTQLKTIEHPEIRLKKSEYLTTEKQGRYQSDVSGRGAYSPHSDPKEVEIDNFAREIATTLNQARNNHEFKKLVFVTSTQMNGLLNQHLDKHVKEMVTHDIQKDVVNLSEHEFLSFLKTHMQLT